LYGCVINWNLGNMIYNGLITHRLCGFPFAEIGVVSERVWQILPWRVESENGTFRLVINFWFYNLHIIVSSQSLVDARALCHIAAHVRMAHGESTI
jgi:hypothetical protein